MHEKRIKELMSQFGMPQSQTLKTLIEQVKNETEQRVHQEYQPKRINKKQEYREFIIELVKLFKPKTYVEIGARYGYVFNSVSPYCERSIAVDLRLSGIKKRQGVECFQMSSQEFSEQWNEDIDLLFIDADHNKKAVLQDFTNLSKWVKPITGLILLHDTYPVKEDLLKSDACSNAWEAARLIHEHLMYHDFEIVTLPGPYAGLSIIRSAPIHGWMQKTKTI